MGPIVGIIFHGIGTPTRDLEPGEAPYWISVQHFETILDQVMALSDPRRIRISFDDGNASDHDLALPRLLDRGLYADFFVLSGRIGHAGSLSAGQVRALDEAGMGVGSHGIAHRNWRLVSKHELESELVTSRQVIEGVLGHAITTAGIPFGSYDARVLAALRRAGYIAAYSSDRGPMNPRSFLRPRTSVQSGMSEADIVDILKARMTLGRRVRRSLGMLRRQWL
jgi:peptidoglycan/xylan/chitin deacetylase (PgdA/CDA1 family)